MKTFTKKVNEYVRTIPAGEMRTYREVAKSCGSSGAARAVGSVMANNFDPEIPCHRVVRGDGSIGNYNRGGTAAKKRLLLIENVTLKDDKVILKNLNT